MRPFARLGARRVAIFTVFCGILGCARDDPNQSRPQANADGPSIRLLDLDGQPVDLWQKTKGAISVVLFTRTDCPISNRCAPEIRRLHEKYHSMGVKFFLIYVDPRERPDDIRRHLQEYEYPCQGLRDPEHTLVAHCEATTTPEAVVFDADGKMTYRGRVDDQYADLGQPRAEPTTHDLADAIESTIVGRPVAHPRTKAIGCLIADLKN